MPNAKKPIFRLLPVLIGLLFSLDSCTTQDTSADVDYEALSDEQKRSPEYALAGLEIGDGLQATAFATEPMLVNPTNMDIDHRGRVWVCEGVNYRPTLNPDNPTKEEGDRILILEDEDGDGKADKSTVFYQGNDVNAALGIWVMGNRAIVSCSPHVFLLTDTDGDDRADKKEVLFEGIGGEQHDHAIHAATFGPDGKMYFNFGNAGEKILDKDGQPVTEQTGVEVADHVKPYQQGMVFRCDADGSNFEVLGHNFRNNYEVTVDSYGTLWQSDNDDDGNKGVRINYVMEYGNYGYRDQETGENWRSYRTGMEEEIPRRHWHLNDPGVVPNLLQTGAGSPTGILVYEGDLLPERFQNQVIHADAGPNVVRAYPVENEGAGYSATIDNLVKGKDQWFRPSDVCVAPDGSLFIADWYDPGVGGHQVGDLQEGRIFRLAPEKDYTVPSFDLTTPAGAVEALKNPNLSARYQAWQKLHAWGAEAETVLAEMAKSDNPRYRARALWLLSKMDEKGEQYVQQALQDKDVNLRIAGIRMARQRGEDVMPVLTKMKEDDSPQVRREVAIALRYQEGAAADQLWAELATQHDGQDRWYLEALGIGADEYPEARFQAWIDRVGDDWDTQAGRDIVWRMRSKETIPLLAQLIRDSEANSYNDRLRYFRAFDFRQGPSKEEALASLAVEQHPQQGDITLLALNHLSTQAVKKSPRLKQALKTSLENVKGSKEYLELIKRYELKEYSADLLALAMDRPSETVGGEAIRLQMDLAGTEAVKEIVEKGDQDQKIALIQALKQANNEPAHDVLQEAILSQEQPLAVRKAAVLAFSGSWGGEDRLINIIRSGDLNAALDSTAVQALSSSMRNGLYQEASELLGIEAATDESSKMAPVKELLAIRGDAGHGETIFAQYCQNCHLVNDKGVDYGPGLSEIGDKLPKEALYTAILEPSRGISFGYEGYTVELKDGSQVMGYILSKNEDEVQMQLYGGLTNTYKRSQIASIVEMDQSLMFDNLERAMSQQDLVDLVEYLSTLRKDARVSTK